MTAFQPGSLAYEALIAERDKLRADNERHRNDYSILKRDYDELRADNARLRALVKKYEDEQCASCRAYREIEARRALEPKP